IIKPLLDGFDVMKAVLFRPFDLRKWLAIGFAAFLTGHFGGGGSGFNFNPWRSAEKRHVERPFHIPGWEHWRPWLPLIVLLVFTFMLALVVFFMWLSARGTFVFTDCIVRNRGAVGAPWREYRQEGNSLFGFRLAISAASVVAVMLILGLFLSFSAI